MGEQGFFWEKKNYKKPKKPLNPQQQSNEN